MKEGVNPEETVMHGNSCTCMIHFLNWSLHEDTGLDKTKFLSVEL